MRFIILKKAIAAVKAIASLVLVILISFPGHSPISLSSFLLRSVHESRYRIDQIKMPSPSLQVKNTHLRIFIRQLTHIPETILRT